jgi:hypothetical protein
VINADRVIDRARDIGAAARKAFESGGDAAVFGFETTKKLVVNHIGRMAAESVGLPTNRISTHFGHVSNLNLSPRGSIKIR